MVRIEWNKLDSEYICSKCGQKAEWIFKKKGIFNRQQLFYCKKHLLERIAKEDIEEKGVNII